MFLSFDGADGVGVHVACAMSMHTEITTAWVRKQHREERSLITREFVGYASVQ